MLTGVVRLDDASVVARVTAGAVDVEGRRRGVVMAGRVMGMLTIFNCRHCLAVIHHAVAGRGEVGIEWNAVLLFILEGVD